MNHQTAQQLLNDYVDGVLGAEQRSEYATHLAGCPRCRKDVEDLQQVLAAAHTLPSAVAPERDLWPGITERIAAETGAGSKAIRNPRGATGRTGAGNIITNLWAWLGRQPVDLRPAVTVAAMAVLLVGVTLVWRTGMQPPGRADGSGAADAMVVTYPGPDPAATAMLAALEKECSEAASPALALAALPEQGAGAETKGMIAQNLRIIELAIADLRKAWANDPGSPQLLQLLTSAYRTKSGLHRFASKLTSRI